MNRFTYCLLALYGVFTTFGCATLLNGRYQQVHATLSPETTLVVNDQRPVTRRESDLTLSRDARVQQIVLQRPGYKTEYEVAYQSKRHWLYYVTLGGFWWTVYAPLADNGDRAYNYERDRQFGCHTPLPVRQADQYYLNVGKNGLDISADRVSFVSQEPAELAAAYRSGPSEIDETFLTDVLRRRLREQGYTERSPSLLSGRDRTLRLGGKVDRLTYRLVEEAGQRGSGGIVTAQLEMTFDFSNRFGVPLTSVRITARSGRFSTDYLSPDEVLRTAAEDALTSAFVQLFEHRSVIGTMQYHQPTPTIAQPPLAIHDGPAVFTSDLPSSVAAAVTVKTERGHGSGLAVSNDGYVVTNYHVIAGRDSLHVLLGDRVSRARVIRTNPAEDLALLRVDHQFAYCFDLSRDTAYALGQDVFAIGTPTALELGQTVSKGILSGIRSGADYDFLQTDVAINPGNSGGALVDPAGRLIGVVTAKISGADVEGISFAIPAHKIRAALSLE